MDSEPVPLLDNSNNQPESFIPQKQTSISSSPSHQLDGSSATPAANGNTASLKNNLVASAQSTMAAINDHPTTQSVKDTISNGPVGQNVKEQSAITKNEFADLANSRTVPDQPAATGQPLTHYHSLFYRLLSWKNPRATAISYAAAVIFIFASRYLNILRYVFKALYIVLGLTTAAEAAGKLTFGHGFISQVRPRKYVTIPKASLERFLDDAEQLINFFVIEFQRIVFAENIYVTGAAFFSALISYWLIKFTPFWGLSLIGTSALYLGPLVYISNKELIDAQLENGRTIIGQQAGQVRDLAAQHTGRASETIKTYAGEYSSKAQEMIGNARGGRGTSPDPLAKKTEFPIAPKQEPISFNQEPIAPKPTVEPVAQAI